MTVRPGGMLGVPSARPSYLATLTLEMAIDRRNRAMISQDEWEAFAHVWRTSAVRHGSDCIGYTDHPTDSAVALIVRAIPVPCCVTR